MSEHAPHGDSRTPVTYGFCPECGGAGAVAIYATQQTEEVTMQGITEAKRQVVQTLDWLEREVTRLEHVVKNASEAGDALSRVVYEFTEDPEGVGTDRLREAYNTFGGLSAGNFA